MATNSTIGGWSCETEIFDISDQFLERPFPSVELKTEFFENTADLLLTGKFRLGATVLTVTDIGLFVIEFRFSYESEPQLFDTLQGDILEHQKLFSRQYYSLIDNVQLFELLTEVDRAFMDFSKRESGDFLLDPSDIGELKISGDYVDAVYISQTETVLGDGIEEFSRILTGSSLSEHRDYEDIGRWAACYSLCFFVVDSEAVLQRARRVVSRAAVSWAALDFISRKSTEILRTNLNLLTSHESMLRHLNFWRRRARFLALEIDPCRVSSWGRSAEAYVSVTEPWKISEAFELASEGLDSAASIVEQVVVERRNKFERRVGVVLSLITLFTLLGLFAQLVDFYYSDNAPGEDVRARIVGFGLASLAIAILLLILPVVRRK